MSPWPTLASDPLVKEKLEQWLLSVSIYSAQPCASGFIWYLCLFLQPEIEVQRKNCLPPGLIRPYGRQGGI